MQITSRSTLYETPRFDVVEILVQDEQGAEHRRVIADHAGSVVVVPALDNGRVCLIRNWRAAVEQNLLELPAGTLEPGESPETCARRELKEETGYSASRWTALGAFFVSPGIMSEQMHLFVAQGLTPGEQQLDPGERIETCEMEWNSALLGIENGDIEDAKTIIGLLRGHALVSRG